MPDRDHRALGFLAVLAGVLSVPALSQAQNCPVAKIEPWSRSEEVRAYATSRPSSIDAVQLPRLHVAGADPFSSMLHKAPSRNVNDPKSMQVFGSLSTRSMDPRDESDLLRRCSVAVRDRLKELRLPFDVGPGRAVNLGSLGLTLPGPAESGTETLSSDTAQTAAFKAAERKRHDHWKVSFPLTYRGIPLEKSTFVVILASGDNLGIDWRHLPRLNQIPPDSELKVNVSRDRAQDMVCNRNSFTQIV